MTTLAQIQLRNDTAANWTSANTILAAGEFGVETDTLKFKIGNGSAAWNSLQYGAGTGAITTNASLGSPNLITSGGGITPLGIPREFQFIEGAVAATTITAAPAVAAGVGVGNELILRGCDNTKTVTINNGTGLNLNGSIVMGLTGPGCVLYLIWDGTSWNEVSRQ